MQLSCCFIDLDDFKRVKDRRGHVHGNLVLAEVARSCVAPSAAATQSGAAAVTSSSRSSPKPTRPKARRLAKRLRPQIATTRVSSFHESLTASVGVAEWTPGTTAVRLLARASGAPLAAKALDTGIAAASEARVAERVTARGVRLIWPPSFELRGTPGPDMTADTVQPARAPDPAFPADRGRVARHQAFGEPVAGNRAGARLSEGSEPRASSSPTITSLISRSRK